MFSRWPLYPIAYLQLLLLLLSLLAFGACDIENTPHSIEPIQTRDRKYQESPMLKERVEAGELPPVEDRLPDEPLVIEVPEIGKYGGTLGGGDVIQSDEWNTRS